MNPIELALEKVLDFDQPALVAALGVLDDIDLPIEGKTLLLWACSVSNDEGACFLLESGADPNARTEAAETAFMLAAHNGMSSTALSIPLPSINSGRPDEMGRDELMHAASGGHVEIVARLAGITDFKNARRDLAGRTALQWALIGRDDPKLINEILRVAHFDESMKREAIEYAESLSRDESWKVLMG